MIEFLFTIIVFALAAGGIGIGLALGRGPAKTSCGASACQSGLSCAACPHRKTTGEASE
ncbi:hypothetical protein [Nioella nitratireducens]|uniref:hypothetical protein n=1 Tax=Nioella nitratireducens TaxID=1287720 RepID=UPI0013142001|nr:hypothetical protein [Nioella nitratireducens]